jgi:hypothetical protein
MKLHLSNVEAAELADVFELWRQARNEQATCVSSLIDILDVTADEAVDLLNKHRSSKDLLAQKAVEIHSAEACKLPWIIDGETSIVMLLAIGGYLAVCFLAG